MKLGEKIYQHRKLLGLSQEELAERLGVTRQAVSKWELDASVPELETVVALAKLFGVSTDYLLSAEEPAPQAAPAAAPEQPPRQDWLDRLPGFIGKLLRRYGWLSGVYLAVGGVLFTLLGALARYLSQQMFSSFGSFGSSFGGMDIYGGFGDSIFNAFDQQVSAMAQNNPVTIMGTFIMVFGIVLMIGGTVLAVWLKKKFSDPYKEGSE